MSGIVLGESFSIAAVRWFAVVPAAVVANIVFDGVFIHIARWNPGHLLFVRDSGPMLLSLSGAVGTLAFILFGALVAPYFRAIVALVLLVLAASAGSIFASLMIGEVLPNQILLAAGVIMVGHCGLCAVLVVPQDMKEITLSRAARASQSANRLRAVDA